ncbi:Ppx/GppA family phosphatase [Paraconexibacter antarcticus]|uniref:Ppx/GppA family phosphatase n=1 Tax=Paraconexibacter antarcticus TaxID=2949664 RepID=A0ABY5DTI3_9ACTN|nr:Ppx/GppA phosphatase family protein [Paraconexibacter antarcticus]UTI64214.1 Ppx/GppA family phosphatase [Paraconexibacter antarcticus]
MAAPSDSPDLRLAVVDLGSNSFRLVVFEAGQGTWRRTDEIYEPVRIGEGMGASGELGKPPIARALDTLDVFAHFARASGLGAGELDVVATSAIREAANSATFLARARGLTGLAIRVLSKEQEAHYGYLAAVNSTTLADGGVLDLGGGSMQLVHVVGRHARETSSWRMGAVRMTERFLPGGGPQKRKALDELRAHVTGRLEKAEWLPRCGDRIVGTGGTVRNLAAAVQRAEGLPSIGVQGQVITLDALDALVERLAGLPAAERRSVPGIKPGRADVILAGAVVVRCVLETGGFAGIEATEAGLREGVFFERLLRDEGDPPLLEDVRRASVLNLAARYRVEPAHTEHVARLALGLFDELAAAGLHDGDPIERELLWAACCLHDIGMSVDYDDHHKHSQYLILNAGLPGFTPAELAIIAQAARYHRKGMPDPGPMAPLLNAVGRARLDRCAVLLRLAEDLERARDQAVTAAHVTVRPGEVRLRLEAEDATALPRWAAEREVDLFARAFGRDLVVR